MINFVAIDFETANAERDSACALGAVVVRDGKIVDRRYSLINPQVSFNHFCTQIHGIREEDVLYSPSFADIYPSLYKILNGQTLVAHNVSFDFAVLTASCESRNLTAPSLKPFCTVEMARKAWPEQQKYRLNLLCAAFNMPLKHHNAIEDATACAKLLLRCAEENNATSVESLRKLLDQKASKASSQQKKQAAAIKRSTVKKPKETEALENRTAPALQSKQIINVS